MDEPAPQSDRPQLLMLNGPNLVRLGNRKRNIYGRKSLDDVVFEVEAVTEPLGWTVVTEQSDNEAELIGLLFKHPDIRAAIINPGALMIAGWSFRDALEDVAFPWVEVHISNIWARETFRHNSILSPIASGVVAGLGTLGYPITARASVALATARADNDA